MWLYFLLKLLDLVDTIFFVLRKKQNQVTFLHVYHHVGMAIATWVGVKYLPGGHAVFLGTYKEMQKFDLQKMLNIHIFQHKFSDLIKYILSLLI